MILNEIAPRGMNAIVMRHAERSRKEGKTDKAKKIVYDLRLPLPGEPAVMKSLAVDMILAAMSIANLEETNKEQMFRVLRDMIKSEAYDDTKAIDPVIRMEDLVERIRFMLGVA